MLADQAWEPRDRFGALRPIESAIDDQLEACNDILGGCGVEAITANAHVNGYYMEAVALYVNMGDTYDATVLYDTARERFYVTCYGDWVETAERTRRYRFA